MANNNHDEVSATAIGAAVKIEGDLIGEGDIRVEGFVSGTVKTSRNLYVGPSAKIQADIEAENAIIAGAVKGEIKASSGVVLEETARVSGNITCERFAVAEGARFTGTCSMPEDQSMPQQDDVEVEEEDEEEK